jgi:two-component system nitrogen regulation response regulator GlnG
LEPEFYAPHGGPGHPLRDPFLSRLGPVLQLSHDDESILLDAENREIEVDGRPVRSRLRIARESATRGIVLRLSSRIALLLHEGVDLGQCDGSLIGHSAAVEQLRRNVAAAAAHDVPVLILGETGTGKEVVAKQIHQNSRRALAAFVAINMSTLTHSTATSQLFGHRRGAFTGAEQRHIGLFERAQGGTLLLDEIGDTPGSVQPMLLRVLETGRVLPLGDEQERPVDVRVIAATERFSTLATAVDEFRSSLIYRLGATVIQTPPLRDRPDDIPRLLMHFLVMFDPDGNWLDGCPKDPEPRVGADLVLTLLRHPFPGNVRELRNLVVAMVAEGRGSRRLQIPPSWASVLCVSHRIPRSESPSGAHARGRATPDHHQLHRILEENDWSPARAAQALGISNSTMHYWMRKSDRLRRATDIDDGEIALAKTRAGGNLQAMARDLSVSPRALRMRMTRSGS